MSFFQKVVTDIDGIEKEFLGPDYKYYNFITKPSELGISGKGNVGALSRDIAGIMDYVQVLVSGKGPGNSKGQPLGDRFFLKTGGQCKDYKTGRLVSRSMYIDNVPTGAIPVVSGLTGVNFPEFRGLVPGIVDNIMDMNPLKLFSAFMEGSEPTCAEVKLPVIGEDGRTRTGDGFVPISELQELVKSGKITNVVSREMEEALKKSVTQETFETMVLDADREGVKNMKNIRVGRDAVSGSAIVSNAYYLGVLSILFYIMYKMMRK